MPRRTKCKPFRKTQNSFTLSSVALALGSATIQNCHQFIFPDLGAVVLSPVSRPWFQCRYKSLGYRTGPSRRAFCPARQAQPHAQILVNSSSDLFYAVHDPAKPVTVRQAEAALEQGAEFELEPRPLLILLQPIILVDYRSGTTESNAHPGEHK